jgi:alkylhydroperoxidase/carboxymuconolactone decarboxylase family protein YurZ
MTKAQTSDQQRDRLRDIANDDDDAIAGLIALRVEENIEASGLDPRTYALCNLAALVAGRAETPSYVLHVGRALNADVAPDDMISMLTAIAPNVGIPKVVDAAPKLGAALGIDLAALTSGDTTAEGTTAGKRSRGSSSRSSR